MNVINNSVAKSVSDISEFPENMPQEEIINSYDKVPYNSYPFSQTHPQHLYAVGKLFGMEPPKIETARILELGCASGGNILPMAYYYPKATFVGVDYSRVQIEEARRHSEAFKLKNITFEQKSIADIKANFGTFDYIITHGVYSWVPGEVREAILRVSKENLSPNGIAYISYNTLPGWNFVSALREMMMYHTKDFPDPTVKVEQAKALLELILKCNSPEGFYHKFIAKELSNLKQQHESYLLHEHLEDENHPEYFYRFIEDAKKHGLQYLGDTQLPAMYSGNLVQEAAELLSSITDIVRSEQYMDFINNRRFRQSLLCAADVPLVRKIENEVIDNFYLATSCHLVENQTIDLTKDQEINFAGNINFTSRSKIVTAIFMILSQEKAPIKVVDLTRKAGELLKTENYDSIRAEIFNSGIRLLFSGGVDIYSDIRGFSVDSDLEKPKINDYTRYQISNGMRVLTSAMHRIVSVDDFTLEVMRLCDGKHDVGQIVDKILELVKLKKLEISTPSGLIVEPNQIANGVRVAVVEKISQLQRSALLV